jgi:DNA end-binding protein Ku
MPRSVWRGVINVGKSHAVSFRQLRADHVSPIRNSRMCVASEHDVRHADVVRGYGVSPGNFVVIEDWNLDDLPHPSRRVIGISAFVPVHAIKGGLFFKSVCYVEPEPTEGEPTSCWHKQSPTPGCASPQHAALAGRGQDT